MRDALTRETAHVVTGLTSLGDNYTPVGEAVDVKSIVNGCVALLATGGSTNHTMHLVAIAKAAGITLTWQDLSDLSAVVPLMARIYPNGQSDVNHFHAAGGLGFIIGSLLDAGLMHEDVTTVAGKGLSRYTQEPKLDGDGVMWQDGTRISHDASVLRGATEPFSADGGLKMLTGPIGKCVIKTSAVAPEHRVVSGPARVFDDQADFLAAFDAGLLDTDFVAVLRYQGPQANGMPELHKLTPALGILQDRGRSVALITDGRMSGASGKVPAAIHLTPEAASGGPIAKILDGDMITVDSLGGTLSIDVPLAEFEARPVTGRVLDADEWSSTGRDLFSGMRALVGPADEGAMFVMR